jgi:hypothetical protein
VFERLDNLTRVAQRDGHWRVKLKAFRSVGAAPPQRRPTRCPGDLVPSVVVRDRPHDRRVGTSRCSSATASVIRARPPRRRHNPGSRSGHGSRRFRRSRRARQGSALLDQ